MRSLNSCADQYYDWDTDTTPSIIKIPKSTYLEPSFEKEKTEIYTDNGVEEKVTRVIQINRFEFVAPTSWIKLLNGMVHNDTNSILDYNDNVIPIKNLKVDEPQKIGSGKYSTFTVSYEYEDYIEGTTCCDVINIDDLLSPEYVGGGTCGLFAVTIAEAAGILTPTPTDAPIGTVTYRWYKDGVYLSNTTTINVTDSGNYKVEASVGTCVVNSTYYVPDECALFQLDTSVANNAISATVSNIPDGETVSYIVQKDGITVASALPYTATVSGTYFVTATAGDCSQIQGIYVKIETVVDEFTIGITQANGILTAVTDATSPTYLWEVEVFNASTNTSSRTTIGTSSTVGLTVSGNYHLTITEGIDSKTDYFFFQTGFNVTVENINEIANASGSIQIIENTTGSTFALDIDESRWIRFRNGVEMTYRAGVAAGSLDVNEYDIVSGNLIISTIFPLTTDDIIENRPV